MWGPTLGSLVEAIVEGMFQYLIKRSIFVKALLGNSCMSLFISFPLEHSQSSNFPKKSTSIELCADSSVLAGTAKGAEAEQGKEGMSTNSGC